MSTLWLVSPDDGEVYAADNPADAVRMRSSGYTDADDKQVKAAQKASDDALKRAEQAPEFPQVVPDPAPDAPKTSSKSSSSS